MRYILSLLFSTFLLLNLNYVQGQETNCGFGIKHNQLIENDPGYRKEQRARNNRIQKIIDSGILNDGKFLPPVYTIPVVIHVLYKTSGGMDIGNISDAQINSALANLNDTYGGLVAPSPNAEIQFCLATQSPDCAATTGINRVDLTAFSDYAANGITDANEVVIKAQSKWPNDQYYNIWLVTEINNNEGGFGTQGYAYFPSLGNADKDGTVMLFNTMGYDPDDSEGYDLKAFALENETLIHEIGHSLSLHHTFHDGGNETTCASNVLADCATTGDFICDTEPNLNPNSTCPLGINTCTGVNHGDVNTNL